MEGLEPPPELEGLEKLLKEKPLTIIKRAEERIMHKKQENRIPLTKKIYQIYNLVSKNNNSYKFKNQ